MKKVYILIGLIMISFTIYEMATSFAKYTSEATATAEKQAGAWVIEVNDQDVSSRNSTKQFQIDSLTYPSNDYVLENKIAPSSSGYFDIIINPTGSSVAIRYDVTIDLTALNISDAINFESANELGDNNQLIPLIRTGANTYTGVIDLETVENEEETTARFYLSWDEDLTGTNDAADSLLGVSRTISNLSLPVSVVFSQYSGETIVEYE